MKRHYAQASVLAILRGFSGTSSKLTIPSLRQLANHPDALATAAYRDIAVNGPPAFGRGPYFYRRMIESRPSSTVTDTGVSMVNPACSSQVPFRRRKGVIGLPLQGLLFRV
tara:strand:- start:8289 stop:8621 length:333 start_codon:yes stop_codon:yes gene_type:complete